MPKSTICSVEGCCKPPYAFGRCSMHHRRMTRHGSAQEVTYKVEQCKIASCTAAPFAKGYCQPHYDEWVANGPLQACQVENCGKPHLARGYCIKHYKRWKRYGDTSINHLPKIDKGEPLRFFEEVVLPYEGDQCLTWPYGTRGNGYGCIKYKGRQYNVHRLVCLLTHGEPPTPQHFACHTCGNGHLGCCAKGHLGWGTNKSNQEDRVRHDTHGRGERCVTSKLTNEQAAEIKVAHRKKGATKIAEQLAKRYGVVPGTIYGIWYGKGWKWLD